MRNIIPPERTQCPLDMWGLGVARGTTDRFFRGVPVRLSDSAIAHLYWEDMSPDTLCDMIDQPIDCPDNAPKPHRRRTIRICAYRDGKIYVIMLDMDYTTDIRQDAYLITHVKPI